MNLDLVEGPPYRSFTTPTLSLGQSMVGNRSSQQTGPRLRSLREERRRLMRKGRPEHFCAHCRSALFIQEEQCIHCGERRPRGGWPDLLHANDPWLGKLIDERYLITRHLGQGTSGLVYQAESLSISRQFAVKIIATDQNQAQAEEIITRLNREIEALSRLRNPHIVSFYEILDLHEKFVAAIMDLIDGWTLEELIQQQGPLDIHRALTMLRQVANGLFEAHQAGMIHRDLKPENLMVEKLPAGDDFLYILDFGIVRLTDDNTVSMTHGFIGTPLYASPEQAMAKSLDHRSDIYSLGAILFFMLTGEPPFVSDHVYEVLRMHARQAPRRLGQAAPRRLFPETLEQLLARMLAKSPQERPADLSAVIDEIDQIILDHPSDAHIRGSSTIVDGHSPAQFDRQEHTSATTIQYLNRRDIAETPAFLRSKTPLPAKDSRIQPIPAQIRHQSQQTKSSLHTSPSASPYRLRQSPHLVRATHCHDGSFAILEPGDAPIAMLFEPRSSRPRPLSIPTQTTLESFAMASKYIVAGHSDGLISRIDITSNQSRTLFQDVRRNAITAVAANSTERCIIAGSEAGRVYLHQPDRGSSSEWSPIRSGAPVISIALNHRATTAAVARKDHSLELINLANPRVLIAQFTTKSPLRAMAISPDDYLLLAAHTDNTLSLIQLPTGNPLLTTRGGRAKILAVHFTEQAAPIAICAISGEVRILDFEKIRSFAASY